jgi:putative hydrolase
VDTALEETAPGDQRAANALVEVVRLLDRALAPAQKVRAFHRAAEVAGQAGDARLAQLVAAGRLQELPGIGPTTATVITEALGEGPSAYIERLTASTKLPVSTDALPYLDALRGDCHTHSDWSDGGAPIDAMARAAAALGHEYVVLTDHSARLTVAHGLDRQRLLAQLDEVAALNETLAPFRILTGMEVDILEDGSLDLDDDLLARLDVVVASAHSKLRMERSAMTRRLVVAAANQHVDILGHCTGRKLRPVRAGSGDASPPVEGDGPDGQHPEVVRPQSLFDPDLVFAACAQFGAAVEVNCRPERQDPPDELLALALEWECLLSVDTDAHAPGQLEWQPYGCEKLARHQVPVERVVNTRSADELVAWARR